MSETKTPKELADAVRAAIPGFVYTGLQYAAVCEGKRALEELERIATEKLALESRVARLEEKVSQKAVAAKAVAAVDPGCVPAWCWPYEPLTNHVLSFKFDLAKLCGTHRMHLEATEIRKAKDQDDARFVLRRGGVQEPLPPAESCAHAVERFREALLLLTKRHEVEVEVGHIEPGQYRGGIEQLPDQDEEAAKIDADYRKEFDEPVRERKAWDAIEKWADTLQLGVSRFIERGYRGGLKLEERRYELTTSKTFRGETRLVALEAAAAWCEGQK